MLCFYLIHTFVLFVLMVIFQNKKSWWWVICNSYSRFGTWPVAMLAQSKNKAILEGPICNGSKVIGWHTNEKSKALRRFHVDMSGFAFNSTILWDPKRWRRPFFTPIRQLGSVKEGFQVFPLWMWLAQLYILNFYKWQYLLAAAVDEVNFTTRVKRTKTRKLQLNQLLCVYHVSLGWLFIQETTFIEQVVADESQMEGMPNGCGKIMNWHLHLDARGVAYPRGWLLQKNLDAVLSIN